MAAWKIQERNIAEEGENLGPESNAKLGSDTRKRQETRKLGGHHERTELEGKAFDW